jgi:hypothetical protein
MGVQLGVSCGARGNGMLGVDVIYNSPPTEGTVRNVAMHDY